MFHSIHLWFLDYFYEPLRKTGKRYARLYIFFKTFCDKKLCFLLTWNKLMLVNRSWSEAACTERWLVFYVVLRHGSCFVITCKINKLQVRSSAYKFNKVYNVKMLGSTSNTCRNISEIKYKKSSIPFHLKWGLDLEILPSLLLCRDSQFLHSVQGEARV